MKIVIRAGGVGNRLWPLSLNKYPKQFHALFDRKTMIQNTVDRVKPLLKTSGDLFVSLSSAKLVKDLQKQTPGVKKQNIIIEPASRNTGPAICLESCLLAARFGQEATVASLPADDYISDKRVFADLLKAVEKFLQNHPEYIVTPGVTAVKPDTGYSYIKAGKRLAKTGETGIFTAAAWVEKPDTARCQKIVKSGSYFCHTGMYVWKLKTILDLFKKYQPEMYAVCQKIAAGKSGAGAKYLKLKNVSVESAVTRQAPKVAVSISSHLIWSDLGKWHVVKDIFPANQKSNLVRGKAILLDTKDCLIYGAEDKLIATIGLDNMIVVAADNAVLVCPKERSSEVKKIVEELKSRGEEKYL